MGGFIAPQSEIEQAADDGIVTQADRITEIEGMQEVSSKASESTFGGSRRGQFAIDGRAAASLRVSAPSMVRK